MQSYVHGVHGMASGLKVLGKGTAVGGRQIQQGAGPTIHGKDKRRLKPVVSRMQIAGRNVCLGALASTAGPSLLTKRQFSSKSQVSGWGSHSGYFSGLKSDSKSTSTGAPFDYAAQRRLALAKEAADSQMDRPEVQNAYYRELLRPNMHDSKAPLVIARVEQGRHAVDMTTLQLYLLALMQGKSSPERAAARLIDLLKDRPQLVTQLTGTGGHSGYNKVLQMLARTKDLASVAQNGSDTLQKQEARAKKEDSSAVDDDESYDYAGRKSDSWRDGTVDRPVHVIVQAKEGSSILGGVKWLLSTLLYAFCILTIINLTLESSGVMKTSNKLNEFKPEEQKTKVRFSDVQGCEEAKDELQELVQFLKNPEDFSEVGGRLPKGVLLTGDPGTGKTLLARAVAGEADVPFFFMSGSEFDEIYVGVGASVTGDTQVLVRDGHGSRMTSIGAYIDEYYPGAQEGYVVSVDGVQTLGYSGGAAMDDSAWTKVRQVYRHRVDEIYEIDYLGDTVRTTGDHSVFIQSQGLIKAIQARELQVGDVLVEMPCTKSSKSSVQAQPLASLSMWAPDADSETRQEVRQACLAQGVSQDVTADQELAWLFGVYAAKSSQRQSELQLTFGSAEEAALRRVVQTMQSVFGALPLEDTAGGGSHGGSRTLTYSSLVARFFERQCRGKGGSKHIPELLWTAASALCLAFIDGIVVGSGAKAAKGGPSQVVSSDHGLLREVAWLAAMHRVQATLQTSETSETSETAAPLAALVIGPVDQSTARSREARIERIQRMPYSGYVYDFCGCDNEAFFGGNNPVLLHNSKVRSLFAAAREKAPSIVFIDEIDAIGSKRNPRDQTYMKQTLNQLLVDLDGFAQTEGVIFMAATNFPEVLDPALTRPGRFDRIIQVPLPDVRGRAAILKKHSEKIQLGQDVDLNVVARGTPGFSGAELQNLLNLAAIEASKQRAKSVTSKHLDYAKDRIIMGSERKSAVITPENKLATAYHEGGHTLAAMYTKGAMPLHKVTVMPRGHALGVTVQLPENDRESVNKQEYLAELDVCMGGRAAEELVYGIDRVTSGCSSDLQRATRVATAMVTQFGMSEKIGLVSYNDEQRAELSAEGKRAIESEVRALSETSNQRVMDLLRDHREELDRLAKALVEFETLDKKEIERAVKGLPIERDDTV